MACPWLSTPCAQIADPLPWAAKANGFSPLLNAHPNCVPTRPATTGCTGADVVAPAASVVVCGMPSRAQTTVKVPAVSL